MGAEAVNSDDARAASVSLSWKILQVNILDALRCFCWCLAEHLQADVVVSHEPDLVTRQPLRALFRTRLTIAACQGAASAQAASQDRHSYSERSAGRLRALVLLVVGIQLRREDPCDKHLIHRAMLGVPTRWLPSVHPRKA
jgi:hypothetical protein